MKMNLRLNLFEILFLLLMFFGCTFVANSNDRSLKEQNQLPKIRVDKTTRSFVKETGEIFVPFGVTYYRPGTGWAPQVWKQFDLEATRKDFAVMKQQGVNCVRIFLTYHSFYSQPGVLDVSGLKKFDQFLDIAEEAEIYVHPTGPDHWEGLAEGQSTAIEDENSLHALEQFWKLFAARYRGRAVILGYDLKNEPELPWDSKLLQKRWNTWLEKTYVTEKALSISWSVDEPVIFGQISIPLKKNISNNRQVFDYQRFREEIADEWTRRQVESIKSVDPDALVTVGLIQWSVPATVSSYSAFRPARQAKFLDFMSIHFYPLAHGVYEYQNKEEELKNLAYLESVVREAIQPDKPTILGEFGWYGGGKPKFDQDRHPAATEEQQARYCRRLIETTAGFVCGWLNWGFYDQPEATDCSELTGLATSTGKIKAWGRNFKDLAQRYDGKLLPLPQIGARPMLDWDTCLTSESAVREFQQKYYEAFVADTARISNSDQ